MRRLVFLTVVVFAGGCQCAQLQPGAGFLCDANGDCPEGQACDAEGVCVELDAGAGGGGGEDGGGGSGGGSGGGTGGGGSAATTTTVRITNPADDGVWCNTTQETLDVGVSASQRWVEVGTDATVCRTGLRFFPGLPPGATVLDARIRTKIVYNGGSTPSTRIAVQVYDSASVGKFVDGHLHTPEAHADGGFLRSLVTRGWVLDAGVGKLTHSPNLSAQVQAIVNRPDYDATRPISFELEPDDNIAGWYVGFGDSGLDAGAELIVTWQ